MLYQLSYTPTDPALPRGSGRFEAPGAAGLQDRIARVKRAGFACLYRAFWATVRPDNNVPPGVNMTATAAPHAAISPKTPPLPEAKPETKQGIDDEAAEKSAASPDKPAADGQKARPHKPATKKRR